MLKRITRNYHLRTFSDPASDEPITLDLRRLTPGEQDLADQKAEEYIRKYVTGGWRNALGEWCEKAADFPPIDGASPVVTVDGCQQTATLEKMQEGGTTSLSMDYLLAVRDVCLDAWPAIESFGVAVKTGTLDKLKEIEGNRIQES